MIMQEGEDIGLFIVLVVPKVFLFVGLATYLLNFDWLVIFLECPNVLTINCNLQKGQFYVSKLGMYINYLIPLDT